MGKCSKTIRKRDWVRVTDTKSNHYNTEGQVLEVKKNGFEVELDERYGNTIFRKFKKKQLEKVC